MLNKRSKWFLLLVVSLAFTMILLMQAGSAFATQTPTINPNGGTFNAAQSVTIGNIENGGAAYCTIDGSNPKTSTTAFIYNRAFKISHSVTVRVAVYNPTAGWSRITSAKFIINNETDNNGNSITDLQQQLNDAVSNNQMKLAEKILQQIKQAGKHNQNEDTLNSLKEQLIDAIDNKNWDQVEAILKQIIKLENSDWAYSELGKNNQKKGKNNICVFTNGGEIKFDVLPIIKNGRTLIPIRKVANALGLSDNNVKWNSNGTITIINGSNIIIIKNNGQQIYLNGVACTVDVPAQLVNGRMLVPLRTIGELFKKNVKWYPAGNLISIT